MFEVSIPKISDEELMERYAQIKPVVTINEKIYSLREYKLNEIKGQSYIWHTDEDIREEIPNNTLSILEGKDFLCLHKYGYYGLFKPSIAEVLSQIKSSELPVVSAFEMIEYPNFGEDFLKDSFTKKAFNAGFYVSMVRLYRKQV